MRKAIWILNDQCDLNNPALLRYQDQDVIMMAESYVELDIPYAHQKRTAFILSVNRSLADHLWGEGKQLVYLAYQPSETHTQLEKLYRKTVELGLREVVLRMPKDWHHRQTLSSFKELQFSLLKDTNLISDEQVIEARFKSSSFRMERFYQTLRKQTGLLMEGETPVGGQYNFDQANQQRLRDVPTPHVRPSFKLTERVKEVLSEVKRDFSHQLGQLDPFRLSITPQQATHEMNHFMQHILKDFGQYQDNILLDDAFVAHSLLSAYLNIGLLNPMEVCLAAEQAFQKGHASIEATEGFIRQILGWREYMFYRYHWGMPELETINGLGAHEALPSFYWTAQTKMNCVANAVEDTLTHAYAHHIQRLMVTGNFANLAGIEPRQVHQWYGGVYVDAWPWVELPNTMGMGLYADLGVIASKPYVSSGAYIHRMSNACAKCAYDYRLLEGEQACPFNALYWNYIQQHQDHFKRNPRMSMMVQTFLKFDSDKKQRIALQAQSILTRMRQGNL